LYLSNSFRETIAMQSDCFQHQMTFNCQKVIWASRESYQSSLITLVRIKILIGFLVVTFWVSCRQKMCDSFSVCKQFIEIICLFMWVPACTSFEEAWTFFYYRIVKTHFNRYSYIFKPTTVFRFDYIALQPIFIF